MIKAEHISKSISAGIFFLPEAGGSIGSLLSYKKGDNVWTAGQQRLRKKHSGPYDYGDPQTGEGTDPD